MSALASPLQPHTQASISSPFWKELLAAQSSSQHSCLSQGTGTEPRTGGAGTGTGQGTGGAGTETGGVGIGPEIGGARTGESG